jgi:hypothetical protein
MSGTMTEAINAVARLERELQGHQDALVKAIEAEQAAADKFDETGADRDLDGAAKSRLRRESRGRLVDSAKRALDDARNTKAALEREALTAKLDEEKARLAAWTNALNLHAAKFIALDHELDNAILAVADLVATSVDLHQQAAARAQALGVGFNVPKPTIADARLFVQRALRDARGSEQRSDLSNWLTSASGAWQTRSHTASELADHASVAARSRAQEHDAAVVSQFFNATSSPTPQVKQPTDADRAAAQQFVADTFDQGDVT